MNKQAGDSRPARLQLYRTRQSWAPADRGSTPPGFPLAPVPQPPRPAEVPADHLHLAVQLHPAGTPATGSHRSALSFPFPAPPRRRRGPRARAVRGSACRLAVPTSLFLRAAAPRVLRERTVPSPCRTESTLWLRTADTDRRRIRLAPPEPGDRRGATSFPRAR